MPLAREFGMDMYTLLYLKWITNKDLLSHTRNSDQCYVPSRWEGSLREKGYMYVYGRVSLLFTAFAETITTLLIGYQIR